ncbi:phosphotransferase family protein [Paenibacillus solani]|uniref:phosphotransferase family protein n=1 Tax=Paenibacillus solani TaxID=1705565 RepID=UPI003D276AAA
MRIGELVGMGNTANVYRWGNHEVIKVFHDHFNSTYEANKEAKNAELISSLNLRAPQYSGLLEYEGKSCLVYERIDGPTMLWQIEPTKENISYHAKLMAQLHAEIHQARVDMEPNLKTEIGALIDSSAVTNDHEKQMIQHILHTLPEGHTVCHYDFHPDNIIISPQGPIVIDWLNVWIGHQAADVARSSMMMQSHSLPPNAPDWLANRPLRELFHHEYLKEYGLLTGMDETMINEWMAPTLAARIVEMKNDRDSENVKKLRMILQHSSEVR